MNRRIGCVAVSAFDLWRFVAVGITKEHLVLPLVRVERMPDETVRSAMRRAVGEARAKRAVWAKHEPAFLEEAISARMSKAWALADLA